MWLRGWHGKTACTLESTYCKLMGGSARGLVSAWDFKSYGSRYAGPVGSIPTHFRQISLRPKNMPSKRKVKPFRVTKDVKRRARLLLGSPPPVRREEDPKHKPPKHKKREFQQDGAEF